MEGCSLIIKVYRDRKNNVAFGFKTFVIRPVKNESTLDMSLFKIFSSVSNEDLDDIDLYPRYTKYKAPEILMRLNMYEYFEIIIPKPMTQYEIVSPLQFLCLL